MDCTHSKFHCGHQMVLMDKLVEEDLDSLKDLITNVGQKLKEYEDYSLSLEQRFMDKTVEQKKISRIHIEERFKRIECELQREKERQHNWLDGSLESGIDSINLVKYSVAVEKAQSTYHVQVRW